MIDSITNVFLQPNKKEVEVYKIFNKVGNNYFNLKPNKLGNYFKFNLIEKWISCYIDVDGNEWPDGKIDNIKIIYPRGFHSYMSLSDAIKIFHFKFNLDHYVLCKCQSKFRLIEGIEKIIFNNEELETKVIVSRGIKIIEEIT